MTNYSLESGDLGDMFETTQGGWVDRQGHYYSDTEEPQRRAHIVAMNRLFWQSLPPDVLVAKAKDSFIDVWVRHGGFDYSLTIGPDGAPVPCKYSGFTKYVTQRSSWGHLANDRELEVMGQAENLLDGAKLATAQRLFDAAIALGNPREIVEQREDARRAAVEKRRLAVAGLSEADILKKFDVRVEKIRTKSTAWVLEPPAKTAAGWWRSKVVIDGNQVELAFLSGSWSVNRH